MTIYTVKKEAKLGIIPEHRLRQMLKEGKLPGFYAGNRYYIWHELLMEQIEECCRANARGAVNGN